jgi:hypothetical protein
MRNKLVLILIVSTMVFIYGCNMKKFTEGVVEDAKRIDTTKIPSVFNIDSINSSLDTTKISRR